MSNEMLVFCKSLEGPFTCLLDILDFATHDLDGDWLGRSAKWVLVFAGLHSSVCGTLQSIGTLLSAAQNRGEACGEEYMCKDQFANVVLHCEYISFVDSEQHLDNRGREELSLPFEKLRSWATGELQQANGGSK